VTEAREASTTKPEAGEPASPDRPDRPDRPQGIVRWLVLFSITTGTFMANVDSTAVTVALPTMAREFGVGLDALQWVLSAYLLAITAILPVFGRLADMVGRKRILNTGLALFVSASLVVALAPTFPVLIASRAFQGIGASMFMATIMAVAVTTFPAHQRGRVLGLLGSIVAAGTLLGPALGGFLTDAFGWRSIFFINLPVGLLGAVGTFVFLPSERGTGGSLRQLDLMGAVLFAGFAASLLLGLGTGPGAGWASAGVVALLLAASTLLVLFVLWELRVARPLIDLRLFGHRVFGLGNLAGFLYYVLTVFPPFLFPLYLYEVLGLSTGRTGLLMMLPAVTMLLVSPCSGWWSDRVGSMWPALVALVLIMLAMSGAAWLGPASPPWLVGALLALLGAALGLFNSPNNSAIMGALGRDQVGMANGIVSTLRNLGRAVGVAVVVLVYQAFAGTSATVGASPGTFLAGFRGVFLTGALVGAAAFLVIVLMYRQRAQSDEGAA
jgi:EmrB/QacA subfamily drug resistance transporter